VVLRFETKEERESFKGTEIDLGGGKIVTLDGKENPEKEGDGTLKRIPEKDSRENQETPREEAQKKHEEEGENGDQKGGRLPSIFIRLEPGQVQVAMAEIRKIKEEFKDQINDSFVIEKTKKIVFVFQDKQQRLSSERM